MASVSQKSGCKGQKVEDKVRFGDLVEVSFSANFGQVAFLVYAVPLRQMFFWGAASDICERACTCFLYKS